jgi:hypothetical protein
MHSIEALSVMCLSRQTTLNMKFDDSLPLKLFGDLRKMKLAVQSLAEFTMKYCTDGNIDVFVNFLGTTVDKQYSISVTM